MTYTQPIIVDDRDAIVNDTFDYMGRALYIDSIPYDDDFYMSIFITDDKNACVQFEHTDKDDNIDIDITFVLDFDSAIDFIESNKIDYIERELDVTMYQKKLYVGDFINDIMINESYKSDDI